MKKGFKLIVPSFLAIIVCVLLLAGSTFALFTSDVTNNISVGSATVKVNAEFDADTLEVYSAKAVDNVQTTDELAGIIETGPFAGNYIYDKQTRTATVGNKEYHLFVNNASETATGALLDGDELSLKNMTPGDRVKVTLNIGNTSNVDIKYRVKVNLVSGLKLFEGLKIKLDNVLLQGVSKTGTWTLLEAGADITGIALEVYLPLLAGNDYQNLSTKVSFTVEAVQGNAATANETLSTNINVEQETQKEDNVVIDQVLKDEDELVTVTIPAAVVTDELEDSTTEKTVQSLAVKVEPQTTTEATNYYITSLQTAQSYDLEVLVKTQTGSQAVVETKYNEEQSSTASALNIQMFVGTGLKGVKLYHTFINSNQETVVDPFNPVASEELVLDNKDFFYNEETGYITLMTNSFSEYTVAYNKDLVFENENSTTEASTFTVYSATNSEGIYQTEVVDEETGKTSFALVTVEENTETGKIEITETGAELSKDGLSILDLATDIEFCDGYMLATLSDGVVYQCINGLIYVYDATNYNGYYGVENELDETTFYVGRLIEVYGMKEAFNDNPFIEKLVICKNVYDTYKALSGNQYITRINFEEGTTYVPNRLTFCSSVLYVHIASTTKEISEYAFYNSPEMVEIRIPESVELIGEQAFHACKKVERIIFFGSPEIKQYFLGRDDTVLSEVYFLGEQTTFTDDRVNMIFSNSQSNNSNSIDIYFANQSVLDAYDAKCGTHPGVEFHILNEGPYVFGDEPMDQEYGSWD